MTLPQQLQHTADAIEAYAEAHLFDDFGLMMSAVDLRTGSAFERDFITEDKVPRRAMFDPWSYWTYEDSVMTAGHYLEGLLLKYEITGDTAALERARQLWTTYKAVAYQSAVYGGPGCFLRPYGGFDVMEKFGEPLGTDQAAPFFLGVYRLMKYSEGEERREMVRLMLQMLTWYADQGYAYRYYKCQQHYWRGPGHHHASSYYLPAIAWAATETGDRRWQVDLDTWLQRQFRDPSIVESPRGIAWNFKQGGLLVLREIVGDDRFFACVTDDVMANMREGIAHMLEAYDEPGFLHRQHPASKAAGFVAGLRPDFARHRGMGFPAPSTLHGGRVRPRHEITLLAALAGVGDPTAADEAAARFALRQRVPFDFTHYLATDYDAIPPTAHLYARSVGAIMLDWWRNVWVLRHVMEGNAAHG